MPSPACSQMTPRIRALLLVVALLAAAAGIVLFGAMRSQSAASEAVAELLRMRLPDPEGVPQNLAQWRGKLLIVNFWATWCEPCRQEVPALVRIQSTYAPKGVQIVGIALDSASKVRDFAKEYGINYALVVGGMETIDLSRKFGNSAAALPYTVVLDPAGKVVATRLGGITEQELKSVIGRVSG